MIPYRFSFLYSFVVLYMAYRAWLLRRKYSTIQIAAAGLLAASLLCCSNELTTKIPVELGPAVIQMPVYLLYNGAFLLLYVLSFAMGKIRQQLPEDATEEEQAAARVERSRQLRLSRALLLIIMGVELIGNLICFGLYFTGTSVSNYPKGTEYTASVIRYMHEREEDTPFFRAETTHSQTLNDGALNGYHGVTAFTSSANVKTTEFMKALGYSAKNTYNRYLFEESSPVSNLFLGLKYMIDRDNKDKTSTFFRDVNHFGDTTLLENQAYLPLGFLAERELAELSFTESGNAFVFQNALFTAATGVEGDVWHRIPGENLTITGNGVTIDESNQSGYCRYSGSEKNSNVTYSYVADRDGFMCLNLSLPKRNSYYVSVNGVELYKETISLDQMIAVGDVKTGDVIDVRIVCKADESSTMTLSAALINTNRFWNGYEVLNASVWELNQFKDTRIKGRITCNRDGLLYTSIPQNGNWIALVDGEEAEILLVGDCMAAVNLTEGEHTVEFRYHNAAFSLGWKVSFGCVAVFLLLVRLVYKPNLRKRKPKQGKYER